MNVYGMPCVTPLRALRRGVVIALIGRTAGSMVGLGTAGTSVRGLSRIATKQVLVTASVVTVARSSSSIMCSVRIHDVMMRLKWQSPGLGQLTVEPRVIALILSRVRSTPGGERTFIVTGHK